MDYKILDKIKTYNKSFDEKKARGALDLIRNSGVDTIEEHPSYVDIIDSLIPLRPDEDTFIAALLHRVYENDLVDEQIIEDVCGIDVLGILSGVKKLESLVYVENDRASQVENLRKMILVMAKDIRVILVALTCRLYKMRNLGSFMDKDEIRSYSAETLNLYAPVCARLGIYTFKSKLEDLAFKHLFPEDYKEIDGQLEKLRSSCKLSIAFIKEQLEDFLETRGIEAEVSGRIKNHYSIYRKFKKKALSLINELDDIFAMRIVLPAKKTESGDESTDHLYAVLGLVHSEWKPVSKRFKDYLAVPKPNGYRSLHTVVLGIAPKDMDQPVEIQIRDSEMHRESEYGIASHWFYKESGSSLDVHSQAELIRGLEGIRSEFDLEYDVLKEVEIDLFKDRIFVLTPRGEVKELSAEANVIDFAYSVHTDIGNRCVMAKVNGKIVPLDYELQNNDVVEILTKKDAKPKLRWLSLVKTSQAKAKIKSWFSSQNKESNVKEGRNLLNAQLERLGKPKLDQKYSVLKKYSRKALTLSQRESLVEEVGSGGKIASDIIRKVYPYNKSVIDKVVRPHQGKKFANLSEQALLEDRILVGGEDGLPLKIASCCKPRFGNKIVGYVTRGQSITIHKQTCSALDSLNNERIIFADWKGISTTTGRKYLVGIKINAMIRVALMSDITSTISNFDIMIRDVSIKKARNGVSEEFFLLEFDDLDVFDRLMDKIENIKGVLKVVKDDRTKTKRGKG
ncbi:MAG: RelA/SpoT family protein [Nitrospirota bacterium]